MSLTLFKEATSTLISNNKTKKKESIFSTITSYINGDAKVEKVEKFVLEDHPCVDEVFSAIERVALEARKDETFHINVNFYDARETKFSEAITQNMTNVDYSEYMQEIPEEKYKELCDSHVINMATMDLYALDIIFNTVYVGNYVYSDNYTYEDKYIQGIKFRVYRSGKYKFVHPKEVFSKFIDTRIVVEALKVLIYRKDFIKVVNSHTHKKINILCTKRGVLHILQFISKNHDIRSPDLQYWIKVVLELSRELVYRTSDV